MRSCEWLEVGNDEQTSWLICLRGFLACWVRCFAGLEKTNIDSNINAIKENARSSVSELSEEWSWRASAVAAVKTAVDANFRNELAHSAKPATAERKKIASFFYPFAPCVRKSRIRKMTREWCIALFKSQTAHNEALMGVYDSALTGKDQRFTQISASKAARDCLIPQVEELFVAYQ